MRTLELLTQPERADGSHQIGSPGGYETWHFFAYDLSRKLRICVSFHDGLAANPNYARRYAAYRRAPTRNAPPRPSEFPGLRVCVYEDHKKWVDSITYLPAGTFQFPDGGALALGGSRATFTDNEINVSISVPEKAMSMQFCFRSILGNAAREELFPPADGEKAEYRWIPSQPLCEVTGEIVKAGRAVPFAALGSHNHYFGTGPVSAVARRWIRGFILLPHSAELFQIADETSIALTATETNYKLNRPAAPVAEWKKSIFGSPLYPAAIQFDDRVVLRNPRVENKSTGLFEVLYDAYVDGEQTTAWVEIERY